MPVTDVKAPDGRIIHVEHPEGATEQEIIAYAKVNAPMSGALVQNALSRPAPAGPPGVGARLLGSAEAIGSLGTGMLASMVSLPVAGVAAMGDMALRKVAGVQEPSPTREIVEKYSFGGYQPQTPAGQRSLEMLTKPFQWIDSKTTQGANAVQDSMLAAQQKTGRTLEGYPEITAAMATGVKFSPEIIGTLLGIKLPRSPARRTADVAIAEAEGGSMGLDLRAPYSQQSEQLQNYVDQRFQPGSNNLDGLEEIPGAIARERGVQSRRIGGDIRAAEQMGAQVPSRTAGTLADNMRAAVSGYAASSMPSVSSLLQRAEQFKMPAQRNISELLGVRNAAKTPLSDIFNFRESINANLPSDRASPEYAALSSMKREVDKYLNEAMVNDLVSGSPEAIAKYQDAITQWSDFKDLFDGNMVMRKLQNDEATPEQIKSLLLGMNSIKAPRQAANVVTRLRAVLGDESPEFRAIQQSVLTDILMPVLDAEPNWRKLASNVDMFRKNNPTLGRELFDRRTMDDLVRLRNFGSAVEKTAPLDVKVKNAGFERIAAVLTAGNQLSRGAMRVNLITRIFGMLKPNMGDARKNQIIAEVLGYNPRQSLFTPRPIMNAAATEEFVRQPRNQQELLQSFGQ